MDSIFAAILGIVAGFLIGWLFTRSRVRRAVDSQKNLEFRLQAAEARVKHLQSRAAETEGKVQLVYKDVDQLEKINGIGPVFARRLNKAGINTFAELAAQSPDKIRDIISPKNWQAIDPEGWIAQARQLTNGIPAISQ